MSATLDSYRAFLEAKVLRESERGRSIEPGEVHPLCKPHQRAIIEWAVRGGRRAIFAKFGLGKTIMTLETMRLTLASIEGSRGLIIAPLGVRQEFLRDAAMIGVSLSFVRTTDEMTAPGLYLTNYESVREGKIDVEGLTAVALDEAAILRGFGGTKTFRTFMARLAGDDRETGIRTDGIPYRFVATATPAPNDYIEIAAYAAFLGVMDVGEVKTRFFQRNSEKADELTLHPHKEAEFWYWVNTWAVFLQTPADLGFPADGYELPPLTVNWHSVAVDHSSAGSERDGQGKLLRDAAIGVQDAAAVKRSTLDARIAKVRELIDARPNEHVIVWHDLEDERRALEDTLPRVEYSAWSEYADGHPDALALYGRHYSARSMPEGAERRLLVGPGEKMVLLTRDRTALFAWRKFIDDSGQTGVNCAVFRNEGSLPSSELISEAMAIAWRRWPGARLYTYVDAEAIASSNPGYCFQKAGWSRCGETKSGLVVLEALPGITVPTVAPRNEFRTVYGSQDLDEREALIRGFADGEIARIGAKPVMLGSGVNFQRHCHWAVFAGIGFKFNDFIQAIHRVWRYLQPGDVTIDIVFADAEIEVRRSLETKWKNHDAMMARMSEIIRQYGLNSVDAREKLVRTIGVARDVASGDGWTAVRNDCVDEVGSMETNSVGHIVTSIPFGTQYEYSPSYNDFGHTDDDRHFWEQMDFLAPELLRVLQPGRVMAVHVKDRIRPGGLDAWSFQTVSPFHADAILHYRRHGFAFMGMITVTTDVVRENAQTYRLGWSEQCKDGSKMSVGLPEYVLLFRKPPTDASNGYADVRVTKDKSEYSRARWQFDAHGMWRSSGDRLLMPADLVGADASAAFQRFKAFSDSTVYDHEHTVAIAEARDRAGQLPPSFMLLQPTSHLDDVWTDVTRMRTLNGAQYAAGKEMHLCPLQFDIVDRLIGRFSNPGDLVLDPFGGLMTVPLRAVQLGRRGYGVELSDPYWRDGVWHLRASYEKRSTPTLFDLEATAA